MMDQTRVLKSHKSKFVKQLCYYTIVVCLQIRSALSIFWSKTNILNCSQFDCGDPGNDHTRKGHHYDGH